MAFTSDDIAALTGATVLDTDDRRVGKVGLVYLDAGGAPSWATVRTGFLGTSESFFPLGGAALDGRTLRVPFTGDLVTRAPRVEPDEELTAEHTDELQRHYAVPSLDAPTSDVPASDAPASDVPNAEVTMILSEERLKVGVQTVERGRIRLRKHIVTEERTLTVPVEHEVASLVREPIAAGDPVLASTALELAEAEYEVVLHGEVVVTDTRIVPVERIRLGTRRVSEAVQVAGEVRKERLEAIDQDGTAR